MATIISRKQLYDSVWQQPITRIAKNLGISDVGLRKVCKRHSIPTPPAGYWAKVAHGKCVTVLQLPDPDNDRAITIWRGGSGEEPEPIAKARADALSTVSQASTAMTEHPVIDRTLAKLRAAKPTNDGLVRCSGAKVVRIVVRPESLERTEQLLRQLIASGEAAGLVLKPGGDALAWHVGCESVAFELVEAADQIDHKATEKELAAHAKWKREREEKHERYGYWSNYGEPKIPKWERRYNGRLSICLEKVRIKSEQDPWGRRIRGTFADSRTRDVSRMIPSIIATIAAMAAAKRSNAVYEERRRVAEELARQRWQEEERRRYEWQRASKLLDELIEVECESDRLRRWLTHLRGNGPLPRKTHRLAEIAAARLDQLEGQLSSSAIEQRLDAARLFVDDA